MGGASRLLGISTLEGLYRLLFLNFGHTNAPGDATKIISLCTNGIPDTFGRIDDLLVASKTIEDHLKTSELLFRRFAYYNIAIAAEKCEFFQDKVQYLESWWMLKEYNQQASL